MRHWMALAWLAPLGFDAHAQLWRPLGLGTIGPTSVQCLFGDSVSDRLLAGGTFEKIRNLNDTILGFGMAAWNGSRWDSVAHRIQSGANGVGQTYWFLRYQNRLFSCGNFALLIEGGGSSNGQARLNELTERWEPLECLNDANSNLTTLVPRIPTSTLYATGFYEDLCGFPISCVFRYDGSAFHIWPPFNDIPYYADNSVGSVFEFRGKTYMAGLFRDPFSNGLVTLLRHNGTAWEYVPGWGTVYGVVKDIAIRNDTLYVAGAFRTASGGPGNGVAAFDGEQWNDLGGGLSFSPAPSFLSVLCMRWHHDALYVGGQFTHAAGIPVNAIAKWNGRQWCSLPSVFTSVNGGSTMITEIAVWRDSLFVSGGFAFIDGEPARQVAQWLGGDAVLQCSSPVGVWENSTSGLGELLVRPIGGHVYLVSLPSDGSWRITVADAAGRSVQIQRAVAREARVDLGGCSAGLYLITARREDGGYLATKLVLP